MERPELTSSQRDLVFQGLGLLTAGIFDINRLDAEWESRFGESVRGLEQQVRESFSYNEARAIFATLEASAVERTAVAQIGGLPLCSCSTDSDWCDRITNPDPYCAQTIPCIPRVARCGFLWLYDCNGICL